MKSTKIPTGRLAPSPTGFLHLGNAWSFLWAWAFARQQSGQVILRIEDIDQTRSRSAYVTALMEDLTWLGLDWDLGPRLDCAAPSFVQSQRQAIYSQALDTLSAQDLTYPCFCTRKELKQLASAPHLGDEGLVYPGLCRNLTPSERKARFACGQKAALRLKCPLDLEPIVFTDLCLGQQSFTPKPENSDLPLRRSDGVIAYQLACVLDDALMGVTQVVRGRDLLSSTPRQILLARLLGLPEITTYAHIPLLLDASGERLAKRHQSLTLRSLRAQGVQPSQILGLCAFLAGLTDKPCQLRARELLPYVDLAKLGCANIVLTQEIMATFGLEN